MKNIPELVLNLLQNPSQIGAKQDLFVFQLVNGTLMCATDGTMDIRVNNPSFNGVALAEGLVTFSATEYGQWSRGQITTNIGTQAGKCTVKVIANQNQMWPGLAITLLAGIQMGLLDGATLYIFTAYMQTYGDTTPGLECKFVGICGELSDGGRLTCEIDVNDLRYLWNLQVPHQLLSSQCRFVVGDADCGVNLASYTENHILAPGSTNMTLNLTSASAFPAARIAQGRVIWTSGANSGLTNTVRAGSGTQLSLTGETLLTPKSGDGLKLIAGCDNTLSGGCLYFWGSNNQIHFGGIPFCPAPDSIL